jgi:hypothetical protein
LGSLVNKQRVYHLAMSLAPHTGKLYSECVFPTLITFVDSDFGCTGPDLGSDYSLTSPVVIDLTDWDGRNVSQVISSVLCAFL